MCDLSKPQRADSNHYSVSVHQNIIHQQQDVKHDDKWKRRATSPRDLRASAKRRDTLRLFDHHMMRSLYFQWMEEIGICKADGLN